MTIAQTKSDLRARVLALRQMLGAAVDAVSDGANAADRLRDRLLEAAPLPPGAVVAGYWPMRGEIDVLPVLGVLAERGQVTALPVVVGQKQPLLFRRWSVGDPLDTGVYDTRHPVAEAEEVRPHALLVPLLAFDRQGFRLGYGGGFYDRTLAELRATGQAVAIGIAYAGQEVERVPTDHYDERLDWIVTEKEIIRVTEGGALKDGVGA